jgi:ribosomal protein S18 acetylase RimI-like enzyme
MSVCAAIRAATLADVPQIAALAESVRLVDRASEHAGRTGFLVSGYAAEDYAAFIASADHFYVQAEGGEVVGFVLACSSERLAEADRRDSRPVGRPGEPWVLIKQICTRPGDRRRGVARALHQHLIVRVGARPLCAWIVLQPLNEVSIAFHASLGFGKVRDTVGSDGLARGLWVRLPDAPRHSSA